MTARYEGRTWNDRFLPRLTTEEIGALPKSESLLILPIASVEQHGRHLPVFTDSFLNEHLIEGAVSLLPDRANVWVLPPIYYGKSNEHDGFPGTFSLSTSTLQAVLSDLMKGIRSDGWTKLLIVNSHGGNPEILTLAARDARVELGLHVFIINTGGLYTSEALPRRELEYGIHGGALETSIMLALQPQWVVPERLQAEYPVKAEKTSFKLGGDASFAWATRDLSETGVIGDPTLANPEIGKQIYERVTKLMAGMMLEALSSDF